MVRQPFNRRHLGRTRRRAADVHNGSPPPRHARHLPDMLRPVRAWHPVPRAESVFGPRLARASAPAFSDRGEGSFRLRGHRPSCPLSVDSRFARGSTMRLTRISFGPGRGGCIYAHAPARRTPHGFSKRHRRVFSTLHDRHQAWIPDFILGCRRNADTGRNDRHLAQTCLSTEACTSQKISRRGLRGWRRHRTQSRAAPHRG